MHSMLVAPGGQERGEGQGALSIWRHCLKDGIADELVFSAGGIFICCQELIDQMSRAVERQPPSCPRQAEKVQHFAVCNDDLSD